MKSLYNYFNVYCLWVKHWMIEIQSNSKVLDLFLVYCWLNKGQYFWGKKGCFTLTFITFQQNSIFESI